MDKETIKTLLPLLGGEVSSYRGDWVISPCPFAVTRHKGGIDRNPSFGIKAGIKAICHCFSCGYGGSLDDLLADLSREISPDNIGKAWDVLLAYEDGLPLTTDLPEWGATKSVGKVSIPDEWLFSFPKIVKGCGAYYYLQSRGVEMDEVARFDIRFDPLQKRICFPFRDFSGKLAGIQGRSYGDGQRYYFYRYKGYMDTKVWMGEHTVNLDDPVVLVEGPFDLVSVSRAYPNVLASFSAGFSKDKLKRIMDAREVITFFDSGQGGDAARAKVHSTMKGYPIVDIIPPNGVDAGDMHREEIASILSQYVSIQ